MSDRYELSIPSIQSHNRTIASREQEIPPSLYRGHLVSPVTIHLGSPTSTGHGPSACNSWLRYAHPESSQSHPAVINLGLEVDPHRALARLDRMAKCPQR
ncbi:hypothetical protein LIA77_07757 [Sarocladium implicatum]|nr:hypothetical protein LIA77_07757 [Sarocladium implicatum]